jgi:geranylgeranyl reductase family protein
LVIEDFDLIVAGAGPAGSAAALAARRMAPGSGVLLLDKAAFPRDKACGDGLAPHGVDELRRLGALGVLRGIRPVRRLRLRAPSGREVAADCARDNWVVPRRVLDARLVDAAVAAGAELRLERVRSLTDTGAHVVVNGRYRARAVIGADGANSSVRRLAGLPMHRLRDLAIAVRGYAAAPDGEPEQYIGWVADGWPAYAWSFGLGGPTPGRANVGFGLLRSRFGGDRRELHGRLVQVLPGLELEPGSLRAHHLPLATARPQAGRGRVLLAGDAASLINPLSGEGIYYALVSGRLAATAALGDQGARTGLGQLDEAGQGAGRTPAPVDPTGAHALGRPPGNEASAPAGRRGRRHLLPPAAAYARALRAELGHHRAHVRAAALAIKAPAVVEAGVTAARRSGPVFDALVELGLGRGTITPRLAAGLAGGLIARA